MAAFGWDYFWGFSCYPEAGQSRFSKIPMYVRTRPVSDPSSAEEEVGAPPFLSAVFFLEHILPPEPNQINSEGGSIAHKEPTACRSR